MKTPLTLFAVATLFLIGFSIYLLQNESHPHSDVFSTFSAKPPENLSFANSLSSPGRRVSEAGTAMTFPAAANELSQRDIAGELNTTGSVKPFQTSAPASVTVGIGTSDTASEQKHVAPLPLVFVDMPPLEAVRMLGIPTGSLSSRNGNLRSPVVFTDATTRPDSRQAAALRELQERFVNEVGGLNQDPADPAYFDRWQKALANSDEAFKAAFGWAAFIQYDLMRSQGVTN